MEEINRKIIYEVLTLSQTSFIEEESSKDSKYSIYHKNNASLYKNLEEKYIKALNYKGNNENEFISYISTLQINDKDEEKIISIRNNSAFKQLFGELALAHKNELEKILQTKINPKKDNGVYKGVRALHKELKEAKAKLDEILLYRGIRKSNYDKYIYWLDYIYEYYVYLSKGKIQKNQRIKDEELQKNN